MQVTIDPNNKDDMAAFRQLFMAATYAPPTGEKEEAPKPKAKAKAVEAAPVTSTPAVTEVVVTPPVAPAVVTSNPVIVPAQVIPAQTLFSIDDVRKALMGYAAAVADADKDADKSKGKAKGQEKAKALLTTFIDTGKLSELPSAKYGDLLTAVANATAAVAK